MSTLIDIKGVDASYIVGKSRIHAVDDVSLKIKEGEIIGIVGESGCGKTTLLKVIYGFIEPPLKVTQGKVMFHVEREDPGTDILSLNREVLSREIWWKYVSWIPQGAQNSLNPTLKIRDIFIETLKNFTNMDRELLKFIEGCTLKFNLPNDVLTAYQHQLSGGMKQRVIIALAVALKPKLVLADEPTSALDVVNQKVLLHMIRSICNDYRTSIVLVSHDMDVVGVTSDRIAVMYAGNIVETGEAVNLLKDPLHPYTKALIDSLPRLGDKTIRRGLKGQPPDLANPPLGCKFHDRCPLAQDICRRKKPPLIEVKSDRSVACWLYTVIDGDV